MSSGQRVEFSSGKGNVVTRLEALGANADDISDSTGFAKIFLHQADVQLLLEVDYGLDQGEGLGAQRFEPDVVAELFRVALECPAQ